MTDLSALDTCGCCGTPAFATRIFNRPGLPELEYRIDIHGGFLQRMLRRLPQWPEAGEAPLARLTTRARGDASIALLDAWAVVADVLTFYQERIATEGFLRTAQERRSVLELARAIGYELNPGVAAGAYLAFAVEDRRPPPEIGPPVRKAVVPKGTKVQSTPGQDELPQTFETSADLVARPESNALRPRLTQPQAITLATRRLFVAGVATGLEAGNRLLVTAPRAAPGKGVETRILEVTSVTIEAELNRTRVDLAEVGKETPPSPPAPPPFKPGVLPPATITLAPQPLTRTYVKDLIVGRRWTEKQLRAQRRIQFKHWQFGDLIGHLEYERRGRDLLDLFEPVLRRDDPPAVESYHPAAGATAIPHYASVLVTFDQPVDPATVTGSTLQLRTKATGAVVAAAVRYDPGSRTARVDPVAGLPASTDFTVTVKGGKGGVADPRGLPLAGDVTWSFRTDVERTAPVVVAREPIAAAVEVDPNTTVTATFSESVRGVSTDSFKLTVGAGATDVPATVRYDDAARTATLKPKGGLARGREYTVVLTSGIEDLVGNDLPRTTWTFTTKAAVPPPGELAAYAFGEAASFFGHNAPKYAGLPKPEYTNGDPYPESWDENPRTIWVDSQGQTHGGDRAYLERTIAGLTRDTWAILESPTGIEPFWIGDVAERSLVDYALSGKATELRLSQPDGAAPDDPDFKVRETTAHVRSEKLVLADLPIDDPLRRGDTEVVLDRMVLDLDEGRAVVLSGERRDLPGVLGHEVLILAEPVHEGGFTTLRFTAMLQHEYVRRTVSISANVVASTHGETVADEVLGGGDGSKPNQRFVLRKPPVTHVSAPTASGSSSTVEVRVDGTLWEETASLCDAGPRNQRYTLRTDDDGRTSVIFGDGVRGARPPTGTENVRATYRSGTGSPGMVAANKLTLLQTRPLGVRSVTNPLAATGAEEPESRDAARANAPLAVVTLDRIVSLRDFEDFARAFAGIGKAQAVELRRGERSLVHLTIAAANGDEVSPTSSAFVNLLAAIDRVRDPSGEVVVDSYTRRYFDLDAGVMVDQRFEAAAVLEAVRDALTREFSFERRAFGQPVTAAEVVTLVQGVPGVVMTDLNRLYQVHEPPAAGAAPPPILTVGRARVVPGGLEPGELLLVNPAGITLTERIA